MKNKYNTLSKYIYENSEREYRKETIEGLFRSVLEPVVSNQKIESCTLLKLNDLTNFSSVLKRLEFSGSHIISFSDLYQQNCSKENIWGNTEFVIVLSTRYSACLIWDYTSSQNGESSSICLLYNSKIITDISKVILDNSSEDFKDLLLKYIADRRENITLNTSVNAIASLLNDKITDIIFAENEKKQLLSNDDTLQTAEIVANKAKFIAHEIKNNLSIINLYSKILEKHLEKVELKDETAVSVSNSLNNITNASANVSALINDLRCLSVPYITEFSLKQFILNTFSLCDEKAHNAGVNFDVSEFNDINIKTDKIKLQCSLTNIIFNAIEACDNGNTIKTEINFNDNNLEIIVANNGKMIPAEIQNKIFEPEFTTKETGNGLGLAICKKQMQLLNGDILLLYSNNDETAFKIILPI